MKRVFLFLGIIISTSALFAQQKMLSIEDAMLKARTTLAPENLRQLQFIKGTNDFVYLKKENGTEFWMRGNFQTPATPSLTLGDINNQLRNAGMDTIKAMPQVQFEKDGYVLFMSDRRIKLKDGQKAEILFSKELMSKENADLSPDGAVAYLENHNFYITNKGKTTQVTTDGSEDIVYASTVHQSEFGINKGIFWSTTGNSVAFYRMDQSMIPGYPIVDWTTKPAKNINIKYPMAGDPSHHVTVGIFNQTNQKTIWLKTGEPVEQYLTNISWSPDDRFVFVAIVNREQNHMWLNQYDASTGDFIKTLFEETDDKYTEPQNPMLFVKNKKDHFLWQSRRDGWNHLYLYDLQGNLIKQITQGKWEVTEVKGFDDKGDKIYFMSTEVSPLSKNLYSVSLKTGKKTELTKGDKVHQVQYSSDGEYVIDVSSDINLPRSIQIHETKSEKSKNLLQAMDPLTGYAKGELSIFSLKSEDGFDLYARMFKPINFDSTKKYPVVVYWYGGPHAQMITNSWNGGAGDYWFQYMAQRGYLVFTIDTRGSSNRGRDFEQTIFRRAGEKQMEDMLTGVEYLKTLKYADLNNMGLFGWSYGGFMTTNFMLTHPGIFKAAVAGGPVIDWNYYEIMYTERYMDRPLENPEGFAATDLTKKVGNLKGKLLLIHGMQDNVVVMQHSVKFVKAAVDKGVQVDYMIYPGHEHNVIGKDRAHLYQKVTDYLTLHLSK
jgi:dipeptidyl-peptidase-4